MLWAVVWVIVASLGVGSGYITILLYSSFFSLFLFLMLLALGRSRTILSFLRSKHKKDTSLHIELLDDAWSIDENDYVNRASSEPILNRTAHSKKADESHQCGTPSLDLEWENLPEMETSTYVASGEERETQVTTNSTCSHATSRDSLEWDPIISGMTELMDAETDQLLHEIEMLNTKVLEETQTWSS